MHRRYWQAIASDWDDQIFDTLAEDRGGVIASAVFRLATAAQTAADFGCGIGRFLPLLAANFQKVLALDWAPACLERAKSRTTHLANVQVLRTSPSALATLRGSCDVTLAIQVAIHPDRTAREKAISEAISLTKLGGWLVIVVPSLESVLYAESVRRMFRPRGKSEFGFRECHAFRDPGVLPLGGQPTKHYVAEEILLVLRMLGCAPEEPRRIEYSWRIYNTAVPQRFCARPPWDWLVLARRG